ncbi:MAG: alpha/beta fold hydrolase [Gammaproteobacteria bacterium]|nr:alpha/beta fold hydrolase [Gammaproteobacteria bacterium]
MQSQTYSATLNGLRLHWRAWGSPNNPPVICLHGAWGQSAYWHGLASAIGKDYFVLALDQRGHGASAWADTYSLDDFADDLAALCRHCSLQRLRLIGLSLGGLVAITYAGRQPEPLMQLVVVDIGPELTAAAAASVEHPLTYPESFASVDAACHWATTNGLWSDGPRLRVDLAQRLYLKESTGQWRWRADARSWAMRGEWLNPSSLWPAYRAIACPSLVLRGGDSGLLDKPIIARMCEANSATQAVTIAGAGHSVPNDQPRAFTERLLHFFHNFAQAGTG